MNPKDQPTICQASNDSHRKALSSSPIPTVTNIPTTQMMTVLEASHIALVREFIYLAIVTPSELQAHIEMITMITPVKINPLLLTSSRYMLKFYTTASPDYFKTQIWDPSWQGIKLRIGMKVKEIKTPKRPSIPTITRGLAEYLTIRCYSQTKWRPLPNRAINMSPYPINVSYLCSADSLPIRRLTRPTTISPPKAIKHPSILARVGLAFKQVYEKRNVVKMVPPRRIWQTEPGMKLRAVQQHITATQSSRVGIRYSKNGTFFVSSFLVQSLGTLTFFSLRMKQIAREMRLETNLMATFMFLRVPACRDERSACEHCPQSRVAYSGGQILNNYSVYLGYWLLQRAGLKG